MKIRAIILEGEADEAVLAFIRETLTSQPLSVVFAKPSVDAVVDQVAMGMGVARSQITGDGLDKRSVRARNAVFWLAYRATGKGTSQIARALGRIDGKSVLRGVERAEALRERDPAFAMVTNRIYEHFTGERA